MTIGIVDQGRVRVVTITRPDRRNAVDPATAEALFEAFRAFDADDRLSVAVLTGAGGDFCSGFDLEAAASGDARAWIARCAIPEDWADAAREPLPGPMGPTRLVLRKPVIAAIEGHAVAGGLELALWCDMRVAAETAAFGVYCRRWGVPLIDGGTVRLPRLVGEGRARDLILTGRRVPAAEAHAIGLVDRLVPEGEALAAALALAEDLARFPQGCLRADRASVGLDGRELARRLRREWRSIEVLETEGIAGAARFVAGAGRGGAFD